MIIGKKKICENFEVIKHGKVKETNKRCKSKYKQTYTGNET